MNIRLSPWSWWSTSRLRDAYWWILHRIHPRHRYHMVRIGPPGYYDPSERIFYACVEELRRFVKYRQTYFLGEPHENPLDDPYAETPVASWWIEAKAILADFERWKDMEDHPTDDNIDEASKLRDQLIHRIADIHQFLWE